MEHKEREQLDCFNSRNADGFVSNTFHLNQVDKKELYWRFVYFGLFCIYQESLAAIRRLIKVQNVTSETNR